MSDRSCIQVLANKAIRPGSILLDIGACNGEWARTALSIIPTIKVHCFEPDANLYQQLLINLAAPIAAGQVVAHSSTIGNGAQWSSLAEYAKQAHLIRLEFVHLGACVPVSVATAGCEELIRHGHIEFILALANAQQEKSLCDVLLPNRYEVFRHPAMDDQVLCCSDRFRSTIKGEPPAMPNVLDLCREFGIAPKGVVHVGAHEGHEAARYVAAGITKTLMVEANPAVFARLQSNVSNLPGVITINCAASDHEGTIDLRVTNADQSSSILPLARHAEIYPSVQQTSTVKVPTKTIDQILGDLGHDSADYNLLNLDIQGAELMALKGALDLLPNVQAVLTEINYEELYAGCAMIGEMDAFLEAQGFDRVATATPYHPSWGDAFYIRRRPAPASPKAMKKFLYEARNTLVNGWLNIPAASLREAWDGATGRAHRHLVENGVCQLPIVDDDDHRVFQLLQQSLASATKDRRLNLQLATMLYAPLNQLSTDGMPGWLKKSLNQMPQQACAFLRAVS